MSVCRDQSPALLSRTTILLIALAPSIWRPGPGTMAVLIAALGFVAFLGLEIVARKQAAEREFDTACSVT